MNLGPKNSVLIVMLCVLAGAILGFIGALKFGWWAMVGGLAFGVLLGLIIVAVAFPNSEESDNIKLAGVEAWDFLKPRELRWLGCCLSLCFIFVLGSLITVTTARTVQHHLAQR